MAADIGAVERHPMIDKAEVLIIEIVEQESINIENYKDGIRYRGERVSLWNLCSCHHANQRLLESWQYVSGFDGIILIRMMTKSNSLAEAVGLTAVVKIRGVYP